MKFKIGDTPILEIPYEYKGKRNCIYTKLEYYNFSGSIKDRVALKIIEGAIKSGKLQKGQTIYEATSGNTGISLSAIGRNLGYNVEIYMPAWVSKERTDIMKSYGAKVILVSKEDGGFKKAIQLAEEKARENNGFLANQFKNEDNILAHYETTGQEILNQVENIGGFVSGIGTGGTLMGVGKRLKEYNPEIKVIALEPDKMPILSKGKIISQHKIEGIGDDFIPDIINREIIDDIYLINDDDAINMSRKLSSQLGIGVGISSGANMLASVLLKEKMSKNVVTVFVDDNKKYLSTDLTKDIDLNPNFISNKIEFVFDI